MPLDYLESIMKGVGVRIHEDYTAPNEDGPGGEQDAPESQPSTEEKPLTDTDKRFIIGQNADGVTFYIEEGESEYQIFDAEGNQVWTSKEEENPTDIVALYPVIKDRLGLLYVAADALTRLGLVSQPKKEEEPIQQTPEDNAAPAEEPAKEEPLESKVSIDKLRDKYSLQEK